MDLFKTLPAQLLTFAISLGISALILLAFWIAGRLAFTLLQRLAARAGPGREDVLLLLAQTAKTGLLVCGAITALGTVGVNVSALVAGLGLTGFALGFAFRDALSNVLAGAMILFYRPFRRGDHIAVSGSEGEVREINLRYTIVENETAKILIPNSNLLTNPIVVRLRVSPEAHPSARTSGGDLPA